MTTAAVYLRVSVATEHSVSVAKQHEDCLAYAARQGWEVLGVYTDDGVSATKYAPEQRPAFAAALDAGADVILVYRLDRLARRTTDLLRLVEAGVIIASATEAIDLSTPAGRLMVTLLASLAQVERENLSARVAGTRHTVMGQGRAAGGQRPWPFAAVPNPRGAGVVWRPVPERAEAIKEAARALVAGETTLGGIARLWTQQGLDPLTRSRDGKAVWWPATVSRLLRNPSLYGAKVNHRKAVRDASGLEIIDPDQAILSRAEWVELQAALEARSGQGAPRLRDGATRKEPGLLVGVLRCGACGRGMSLTSKKGVATYVCRGVHNCPHPVTIAAARAEAGVLDSLEARQDEPVFAWLAVRESDAGTVQRERDAVAALSEALMNAEDADLAASLIAARAEARERLAVLEAAAPRVERAPVPGVTLGDMLASAEDGGDLRSVLLGAVDHVSVGPTPYGSRGGRVTAEHTRARLTITPKEVETTA